MLNVICLVVTMAGFWAAAQQPASADPQFDWFAYEGKDPVYERMKAGPNEFYNPILPGFYPDPAMVRVGDDYYLVTSSFSYYPGVPIFHSKDLVAWRQLGHVLDRPSQLSIDSSGISRGIFAPTIAHHNGTFYMITTVVDVGGNFFVTATDPAGPWSDPIWLREIDGIDPAFFFDDDGKVYILNNGPPSYPPRYNGHRAIWMQEYDMQAKKLVGPREVIVDGGVDLSKNPIWIEAPHIFKKDGWYYLICAEGGTAEQHSEVVFRSRAVRGPYQPWDQNPLLTQRHLDPNRPFPVTTTGHADFVETQNGEWWAVFLGVRPYEGDHYNNGRETYLLPVKWQDGWPVILTGTETVPYVHRKPDLPAGPKDATVRGGNVSLRDEFDSPELAHDWHLIRTPRERWYDLAATPGWLTLRARPVRLGQRAQPSFVGRRQLHLHASASTAMRYLPARPGDKAGLVAFHNDDYNYFLAVAHVDGRTVVQLEKRAGGDRNSAPEILASAPITLRANTPIYLKIDARGALYDFSYALAPGEWTVLEEGADGKVLSTKTAQGFVGTLFGLHASTEAR